jgi:transposase-like protein
MATESTRVDVRSRRSWPVAEKERIVAAYRAADTPTGRGEVMRREGVYQSLVWRWGQQIDAGTLGTKRPGPKATGKDKAKIRVRELEAQLERAKDRNPRPRGAGGDPGKMLGAARRRECPRQRELPEVLVTNIEGWAERVGAELAAKAFGVAPRTWRHHAQKQRGELPERPSRATGKPRRPHPAKLTDEEEQEVVDTLCSEEFVDVGVDEVFVTILDDGIYLCSPSTMHRILRDRGLNGQRRQGNPRQGHPRPRAVATAPNMVWVWDISRIPGPAKGCGSTCIW